ncbi:MAG: sugar phosphate isomerase/epimerase [Ardenticatenaceae bacterium]|nr:sugar phosphate isomerase/epimerase [Ardenticatenaceae bacterium]
MQLGFVSAILPDLSLEEVFAFAAAEGFACVELMCWPVGKAERRYAGVTHVDVENFSAEDARAVNQLAAEHGVQISGLGYYPNPLTPDLEERALYVGHIKKMITAARLLGLDVVNTFIGRDQTKSIEGNWTAFEAVWPEIIAHAEAEGVKVAIENCPMLFTLDEWPGGQNMAISPAVWREMFRRLPSPNFGLNFDPSHLVWQHIDMVRAIREFGSRFFHVHAKDLKIHADRLYEEGVMGLGWSIPKIPGLGDVNWGAFFSELSDVGYRGPVCIEVEDRAFEVDLAARQHSLRLSRRYLEAYI